MEVGNKVRIKSLFDIKKTLSFVHSERARAFGCKEHLCFLYDMAEYCGKITTIKHVDGYKILSFDDIPYSWCQDWVIDLTKRPRRK